MDTTTRQNRSAGSHYSLASVTIKPELHLSETTAVIKAQRFLRNAAREIEERHARMKVVEQRINRIYRKPLSRFRALCKEPSLADITRIIRDSPKEMKALQLFHKEDRANGRSYFYLVHFVVSNKGTRVVPEYLPVDIAITAHTLARMVERCSIDLTLELRGIHLLLTKLFLVAAEAKYDEKGQARIGLDDYPDMIFVCCRNRWLEDPRELRAFFSIVTYFEK